MEHNTPFSVEVWTEGKTDKAILQTAYRKLGLSLPVRFQEVAEKSGDDPLLKRCQTFAERPNVNPVVCLFDADKFKLLPVITQQGSSFKAWGNNVFSMALPLPTHRPEAETTSIELYFCDDELRTKDAHGRRLFLSSEFNPLSGKHRLDPTVNLAHAGAIKDVATSERAKIIDSSIGVFDADSKNICLSKAQFANYVANDVPPFDEFNFEPFRRIFDVLSEIARIAAPKVNPYIRVGVEEREGMSNATQYWSYFNDAVNIQKLAMQIFVAATVRFYANDITSDLREFRKKASRLRQILSQEFLVPSVTTWLELCRQCCYLVEAKAPESLQRMKAIWSTNFVLGDIGHMLDVLGRVAPSADAKTKRVNQHLMKADMLKHVAPEFYRHAQLTNAEFECCEPVEGADGLDIAASRRAVQQLAAHLSTFFSLPLVLRTITAVDNQSGTYSVAVKTYWENAVEHGVYQMQPADWDDSVVDATELALDDNVNVSLWPFLIVKDDELYAYARTRAKGYEYRSAKSNSVYFYAFRGTALERHKFDHAVFKGGSSQALFFIDSLPALNAETGVRANLPASEVGELVGRESQLAKLHREVIEIPNENAIIYGPGGIGKTALLQKLTRRLVDETAAEEVLYHNIIWVIAKVDFYDFVHGSIKLRTPLIKSFDSILSAILQFFEQGDLEGYTTDDKKALVLELLQDNRVLLILDNLEVLKDAEIRKILEFFGSEVKYALRRMPDQFKIIVTSRKLPPSGFKPFELHGLDAKSSKQLMRNFMLKYRDRNLDLDERQMSRIHDSTHGIPIVIQHTLARLFEYHEPMEAVLRDLGNLQEQKVIEFSFKEILARIEGQKDQLRLRVLLLLEVYDQSLMARQISDILEVSEERVEKELPELMAFQCVSRTNTSGQEQFLVNEEIRLLTRGLAQKYHSLTQELRNQITRNLTIDKQLSYTSEEFVRVGVFQRYVTDGDYHQATEFIISEINKNPTSVLLRLQYANYLARVTNQVEDAITILEELRETSAAHPAVMKQLLYCYLSLDVPNLKNAAETADSIAQSKLPDDELRFDVGKFYLDRSQAIRSRQLDDPLDPLERGLRRENYKAFALKALDQFGAIKLKSHEVWFRQAEACMNLWNYDMALAHIDRAIASVGGDELHPAVRHYRSLREHILENKRTYTR